MQHLPNETVELIFLIKNMKTLNLIFILISISVFAQKENDKMLDTLYLKDGTIIKGVIKKNVQSQSKIKMCKGISRRKKGKCIKYKPSEVDSFAQFYYELKKAKGVLGFGKKEYDKGYYKYYTISFRDYKVYAKKKYSGQNYDFYTNYWFQNVQGKSRIINRVYITRKNSYTAITWFKPGNINEDIRNAKKVFPKCEKKLEKFRKSSNKKEKGIMEFIDENCE